MHPHEAEYSRQPLTERIIIAQREVILARTARDYSRELAWTSMVDRLLDRYLAGDR